VSHKPDCKCPVCKAKRARIENLQAAAGVEQMLNVAVELLDENPRNPRTVLHDEDLEDLAVSLREHTLLQPLVVRAMGERYQVVCGHRRRAAAIIAGLATVACRVVELDDLHALEAALVENSARRDVPVLEEADALAQLVVMGADPEALADRLGRTRKWVRDRLALVRLVPALRAKVETGAVLLRAAAALALLSDGEQVRFAESMGGWVVSHKDVRQWLRRKSLELSKALFELGDETLGGRGACTACPMRSDAQPELWGLDAEAQCLDPVCWRHKELQWVEEVKREGVKIQPRGWNDNSTVAVDAPFYELREWDDEGRATGEAPRCRDLLPDLPIVLVQLPDGRIERHVDAAAVVAGLRAAGHTEAADIRENCLTPAGRSDSSPAPKPTVDRGALQDAISKLVASVSSGDPPRFPPAFDLGLAVVALVDQANQDVLRFVEKRRGVEKGGLLASLESDPSAQLLLGLLTELLLARSALNACASYSGGLRDDDPLVEWLRVAGVTAPPKLRRAER